MNRSKHTSLGHYSKRKANKDNKNINNCKSLLLMMVILVMGGVSVEAQTGSFMMSSVGMMSNTSSNATAIQFRSVAGCIDVQTGVAVLSGARGSGQFAINCEVTMQYNTLGVRLYPNPVSTMTKLRLTNTPPLTETFSVSIWSTDGGMISVRKETGYNLFQGLTLDLSGLNAGSYVLKIEGAEFVDAIKFIKAN